ncbi:uncharacterized protein LOC105261680 [Musca domestica]|uniref:Uncharacterized protein LOC105261680 n=1 Tax=Musca domestica TaxID=7370 RepID=A0A1I8NKT5_MUSDO|nr:uncharacterized protein LOC105261680 [Musca domestica]
MKILLAHLFLVVLSFGLASCSTKDEDATAVNQNHYHHLMDNLHQNYSPCSEFYEYVCSKWPENHKENKDDYNSVGKMMYHEANVEIIEYLENSDVSGMPDHVKLVKDFYMSCAQGKDYNPLEFMHWLEREENMKWALLTPLEDKDVVFDWPSTMAIFRKYGFNDFLVELWSKAKESFEYITESQMESFKERIALPSGAMDFMDLWKTIEEFEQKFGEIQVAEPEEKKYKFKDLPYTWLRKYLSLLVKPQHVDEDKLLAINNVVCMEDLDRLVKEYDDAFLCRYLELHFLMYLQQAQDLGKANICMAMTANILDMQVEWIYEQLHPELKKEIPKIQQMFNNIIKNVNASLQGAKGDVVPQEFFGKLETMKLYVGNFPLPNMTEFLNTLYKDAKLDANDFYGNYMQLLKLTAAMQMNNAKGHLEKFYQTPTYRIFTWTFRMQYFDNINLLILPLGLLRPPLYHLAYEDIFKASGLGSIMAEGIFKPLYDLDDPANPADIDNLVDFISLYSPFEIYFSSLQPDEIKRYEGMFNTTSLQQLKQLFYINGIHYQCEEDYADEDRVSFNIINLPAFNDAFDCKLNKFLKKMT